MNCQWELAKNNQRVRCQSICYLHQGCILAGENSFLLLNWFKLVYTAKTWFDMTVIIIKSFTR